MALENKLGLTSSADLAREEERISKKKAVELFENGVLDALPAGKFSTLQAIHKYLFEDIYDFANSQPNKIHFQIRHLDRNHALFHYKHQPTQQVEEFCATALAESWISLAPHYKSWHAN